jgi:hypothetical protein
VDVESKGSGSAISFYSTQKPDLKIRDGRYRNGKLQGAGGEGWW